MENASTELATRTRSYGVPDDIVTTSPLPCPFAVGDQVVYTNDYGVQFNRIVRGFAAEPHVDGVAPYQTIRFVYLFKDSWWHPVPAESLRHLRDG